MDTARETRIQSLFLTSAMIDPLADPSLVAYGEGPRIVTPPPGAVPVLVAASASAATGAPPPECASPSRDIARVIVGNPATRAERLLHGPIWREAYRLLSAVRLLGSEVTVLTLPVALRFMIQAVVVGTGTASVTLRVAITDSMDTVRFASEPMPINPHPLDMTRPGSPFVSTAVVIAVPTFVQEGLHEVTAYLDDREASWLPLMVRTG
jgi:hypothetical protein